MDKTSVKSDRPPCPYCGSIQILKNGSTHHKKPKFLCKDCCRQFIENPRQKSVSPDKKSQLRRFS